MVAELEDEVTGVHEEDAVFAKFCEKLRKVLLEDRNNRRERMEKEFAICRAQGQYERFSRDFEELSVA